MDALTRERFDPTGAHRFGPIAKERPGTRPAEHPDVIAERQRVLCNAMDNGEADQAALARSIRVAACARAADRRLARAIRKASR